MNRAIFNALSLDQKIHVLNALEATRAAQQVMWQAFEAVGDLDLKDRFDRLRTEYVDLEKGLGGTVRPVFTETMFKERVQETYERLGG